MNDDIIQYLNNKTCEYLINKLTSDNLLDKGTWGTIYRYNIKGYLVSVKIQSLYNNKRYAILKDPRNIKLEIEILKQLSDYKKDTNFIHFPYYYWSTICDQNSLIFYQYFSHKLNYFFTLPYSFEEFKSIVSQIIISIYYFQSITGYYHNDINIDNFLLNTTDLEEIEYNYGIVNKKIKIFKYYICLWDFGNIIKITSNNNIASNNIASNNIASNNIASNPDIILLKKMFREFIIKHTSIKITSNYLYEFCYKYEDQYNFLKYHDKKLQKYKIKWNNIINLSIRQSKINISIFKALINWIITHKLLDELIIYLDLPVIFPNYEMLDWIDNLPENISECLLLI